MRGQDTANEETVMHRRTFLASSTAAIATLPVASVSPALATEQILHLDISSYLLDRTAALFDGRVKIEGVEATFHQDAIGDMNTAAFSGKGTREITEVGLHPTAFWEPLKSQIRGRFEAHLVSGEVEDANLVRRQAGIGHFIVRGARDAGRARLQPRQGHQGQPAMRCGESVETVGMPRVGRLREIGSGGGRVGHGGGVGRARGPEERKGDEGSEEKETAIHVAKGSGGA